MWENSLVGGHELALGLLEVVNEGSSDEDVGEGRRGKPCKVKRCQPCSPYRRVACAELSSFLRFRQTVHCSDSQVQTPYVNSVNLPKSESKSMILAVEAIENPQETSEMKRMTEGIHGFRLETM